MFYFYINRFVFKEYMAKVYIFIDENTAVEAESEVFDNILSEEFGDKIFLISEDGKYIFLTEEGSSLMIQEYFE